MSILNKIRSIFGKKPLPCGWVVTLNDNQKIISTRKPHIKNGFVLLVCFIPMELPRIESIKADSVTSIRAVY